MTTRPTITAAQPPLLVLYDGECRFCIAGAAKLIRLARPGMVEAVSMRDPAVQRHHSAITPELLAAADKEIKLIDRQGRILGGAAAIARALETRPAWKLLTWLYVVPGLHQLFDAAYRLLARNRYRIAGRMTSGLACADDSCRLP